MGCGDRSFPLKFAMHLQLASNLVRMEANRYNTPKCRDPETASGFGQLGGVQLHLAGDRHNPAATVIALPKTDGNEEQYEK